MLSIHIPRETERQRDIERGIERSRHNSIAHNPTPFNLPRHIKLTHTHPPQHPKTTPSAHVPTPFNLPRHIKTPHTATCYNRYIIRTPSTLPIVSTPPPNKPPHTTPNLPIVSLLLSWVGAPTPSLRAPRVSWWVLRMSSCRGSSTARHSAARCHRAPRSNRRCTATGVCESERV